MKIEIQPHPAAMTPAALRMHLHLLHGAYMEPSLKPAALRDAHLTGHLWPDPPYYVEHSHGSAR